MYQGSERRKHPRVVATIRVIAYLGEQALECVAYNISEGGMLLIPPQALPIGSALHFYIGIEGLPEWISASGFISREDQYQGHYAWAIRFQQIEEKSLQLLRQYLRSQVDRMNTINQANRNTQVAQDANAKGQADKALDSQGLDASYTDPFVDLPISGGLKDIRETSTKEFQLDNLGDQAKNKGRLSKLYDAAVRDVSRSEKKTKKKGWF